MNLTRICCFISLKHHIWTFHMFLFFTPLLPAPPLIWPKMRERAPKSTYVDATWILWFSRGTDQDGQARILGVTVMLFDQVVMVLWQWGYRLWWSSEANTTYYDQARELVLVGTSLLTRSLSLLQEKCMHRVLSWKFWTGHPFIPPPRIRSKVMFCDGRVIKRRPFVSALWSFSTMLPVWT